MAGRFYRHRLPPALAGGYKSTKMTLLEMIFECLAKAFPAIIFFALQLKQEAINIKKS